MSVLQLNSALPKLLVFQMESSFLFCEITLMTAESTPSGLQKNTKKKDTHITRNITAIFYINNDSLLTCKHQGQMGI